MYPPGALLAHFYIILFACCCSSFVIGISSWPDHYRWIDSFFFFDFLQDAVAEWGGWGTGWRLVPFFDIF
jgi:hypothetical protein